MKQKISSILLNIVLILIGIVTVIPFVWMFLSSFKENKEINSLMQTLIPQKFTFQNYVKMNENFNFLGFFKNSLFYSIVVTIIIAYTSTISGFVLSKYRFRGRNALFGFIMATMMIPGTVTIIPKYSMMQVFGWMDTYWALIVPMLFSSFGIFMLRQACNGIPDEIIEAARIDGANEFYIFHRIILPMCQNAISSIAIFQFLWAWEDYLWPYLMITSESKQVLSVGLSLFSGRYSTDYGGLFAATTISIIPVITVYLIFQKRFIDGISDSAVKG